MDEHNFEVRVRASTPVSARVITAHLVSVSGDPLPAWTPGSHVDAVLPNGLVRQYSLCGDPSDTTEYRIAVLHEPDGRGGSAYIHDEVHENDVLELRGPRNHFELMSAPRYRFIAGGIGITAILPMIAAAAASGADWSFRYLARSRAEMPFLNELKRYDPSRITLYESSVTGRVAVADLVGNRARDELLYACGPASLLEALETGTADWPPSTVRFERFEVRHDLQDAPTFDFLVKLKTSDRELEVPSDKSILDVVEEAGIPWPYSCREGTCGTCETRVIAGIADQRDSVLSDDEQDANEYMMICVSRSKTPTLELEI
jgi:ferredoxin-NADP reductase